MTATATLIVHHGHGGAGRSNSLPRRPTRSDYTTRHRRFLLAGAPRRHWGYVSPERCASTEQWNQIATAAAAECEHDADDHEDSTRPIPPTLPLLPPTIARG